MAKDNVGLNKELVEYRFKEQDIKLEKVLDGINELTRKFEDHTARLELTDKDLQIVVQSHALMLKGLQINVDGLEKKTSDLDNKTNKADIYKNILSAGVGMVVALGGLYTTWQGK